MEKGWCFFEPHCICAATWQK